jgi:pimeloyl-ACP methyl ester carboxylesterase
MRKAYADSPYGQIHYRRGGEGTPLLLLHQDPQSSLQYRDTFPLFIDAGFDVIAPDVPGYGMSDTPFEPPTIPDYAEIWPSFLDELGVDKAVVVGHHTGASLACQMAYANPERVSRLVMHGLPWYTEEERQERLARPHMDFSAKEDGSHFDAVWKLMGLMGRGTSSLESTQMAAFHTLWAGDTHWYTHQAAFSYDMTPALEAIDVPTLIVTNTGDILHFVAERLIKLRPDFKLAEIEGGTSFIVRDDPAEWVDAIIEFVKA